MRQGMELPLVATPFTTSSQQLDGGSIYAGSSTYLKTMVGSLIKFSRSNKELQCKICFWNIPEEMP